MQIHVERDPVWPDTLPDWAKRAARAVLVHPEALANVGLHPDHVPLLEVAIHLIRDPAMQALNRRWRGVDRPTNVLSFPLLEGEGPLIPTVGDADDGPPIPLGDVLLSWETIQAEARIQQKSVEHHVAHLVVHGILHLLDFDHERSGAEARRQERMECALLDTLDIEDPYG
jgi:probable rRNA maturation factor